MPRKILTNSSSKLQSGETLMRINNFAIAAVSIGALWTSTLWTSAALAEDKTVSIPAESPALTVAVPKTAKVTTDGGKTMIDVSKCNVYFWVAPKAKTVDEAVANVAEIIKSELKDIAITETKSIKVAGSDAKDIMATSHEADDGDAGTTDVVVFMIGDKVIVACVHGENDAAKKQHQPLLDMLETAKAP
jgi:hypothetical protein